MPYTPYTEQRVADLSPLQSQAIQGFSSLGQAAIPYLGQAANTLSGFVNGNANPFQDQVANRVTRGVTDAYNQAVSQTTGRFNTPGNFDSARHQLARELDQRALSTGLGDALGNVYSTGYENAANRALSSVGALGGLLSGATGALATGLQAGNIPRQQQQSLLDSLYGDFQEQRNYPWQQIQNAASLLGTGSRAGGSTTSSVQGYDPVSQGLGVMQLASSMGSKGGNGAPVTSY
jgi:hypothetical protein